MRPKRRKAALHNRAISTRRPASAIRSSDECQRPEKTLLTVAREHFAFCGPRDRTLIFHRALLRLRTARFAEALFLELFTEEFDRALHQRLEASAFAAMLGQVLNVLEIEECRFIGCELNAT